MWSDCVAWERDYGIPCVRATNSAHLDEAAEPGGRLPLVGCSMLVEDGRKGGDAGEGRSMDAFLVSGDGRLLEMVIDSYHLTTSPGSPLPSPIL